MVTKTLASLLALMALATSALTFGDTRREVRELFARWEEGLRKKDLKALEDLLDPSFQGCDDTGWSGDRSLLLKEIAARMPGRTDIRVAWEFQSISESGNEITVWYRAQIASTRVKAGKPVVTKGALTAVSVLRRTPKGLKVVLSWEGS